MELPANFKPGQQIVIQYLDAGGVPAPAPTPTPTTLPPLVPASSAQAATLQEPSLPVLFPVPPTPAVAKGQSLWNVPVDTLPKHAQSDIWMANLAALSSTVPGNKAPLHPDFGNAGYSGGQGIPYNCVPGTQPLVPVAITAYASESDVQAAGYPIPLGGWIENDTDGHFIVVDKDNPVAWEFYAFAILNNAYTARQVSRWDLKADAIRPAGWASADAAGLSVLAGLVRYDDIANGPGKHAFRITLKPSCKGYVAPASHASSTTLVTPGVPPIYPPMGVRLRILASVDPTKDPVTGLALPALVTNFVITGQKFGFIVADNGTPGYVTGVPDNRFDDSVIGLLKHFNLGTHCEFVDSGPIVPLT